MSSPTEALVFPTIALVGSPNSGKTSLFNVLTGSRQKVGNYAGVTVERKEGFLQGPSGKTFKIVDLPGTYSLDATTLDEAVTRDVLLQRRNQEENLNLVVAVADATNLERSLGFILELKALGLPVVLALNMMDLAKGRGFEIDLNVLGRELGMPVLPVVAIRKEGTDRLVEAMEKNLDFVSVPMGSLENPLAPNPQKVRNRFKEVDRILKDARLTSLRPAYGTVRIDRLVLHPLWGTLLLAVVLAAVFQTIFNLAVYPMDWIEAGISGLANFIGRVLPDGILKNLVIDGLLAGVGAVVVFLPQILLLFFFILLLEDSGYMARAAFLMDRQMRRVGLHGRAFIPLLSSFACAIPGIMATRTIEQRRDRLITILISPLMACSARIPVYTLLISAFIPNRQIWGPIRLQGLVMLGLYLLGAAVGLGVAWLLKKFLLRGPQGTLILELPTYKWPNFRNLAIGMWHRASLFLKRAGTVILATSLLVWILSSYPKPPEPLPPGQSPISYSLAGKMGKWIEPAIRPLGFDWTIGIGLITGVIAREVIVGSLATVYSIEDGGQEVANRDLSRIIQERWGIPTGLSLLVFFVFAMQCMSTLAVARRETNGWGWPAFMFAYLTALAYGAAFLTYRLAS